MRFNFDGLGNLTYRADTGVAEGYGYDILNRLKTKNGTTIADYQANGNINSKTDVAGANAAINDYDDAKPHAVSQYTHGGTTYNLTYDANGNLLTRTDGSTSWNIQMAGFDKPRWMAKTTGTTTVGSEFHYNANRSRVMQLEFDQMNAAGPTRYVRKRVYAMGPTLELNYDASVPAQSPTWNLKTVRIYVPGPDGIIGAREFEPQKPLGQQEKPLVYHYDHLGSITAVTDYGSSEISVGRVVPNAPGRFSEDAWGQRRNPFTWSGAPLSSGPQMSDTGGANSLTPRGYTGHEMLDDLGLVHMNGRIYDPLLGRFLSADTLIQFPGNLQSYNRYSYVHNNPLTFKDESGHFINFVVGALVGAAIDAGSQMVANYASGKSITDINLTSVAISAGMGATGVGLGQVVTKAGATMAARIGANALAGAAEGVIETVATNAAAGKPLTEGMVMNVVTGTAAGVGGDLAGEAAGKIVKKISGAVEEGAQAAAKNADQVADAVPNANRVAGEAPTTPSVTETGNLNPSDAPSLQERYLNESGGRWGGTPTRLQNDSIATSLEDSGYKVSGGAGRASEEWIPGPNGGTQGGTFVDLTATKVNADGTVSTTRVQTVSTLADGVTPTPAEEAAAQRIRDAFPYDELILEPKWPK